MVFTRILARRSQHCCVKPSLPPNPWTDVCTCLAQHYSGHSELKKFIVSIRDSNLGLFGGSNVPAIATECTIGYLRLFVRCLRLFQQQALHNSSESVLLQYLTHLRQSPYHITTIPFHAACMRLNYLFKEERTPTIRHIPSVHHRLF